MDVPLGTIQILRKHSEWVGGVGKMLMLYAKQVQFTLEVCLGTIQILRNQGFDPFGNHPPSL